MKMCPAKSAAKTRGSSTPNHSLVPSVARAALEERMAGTAPAVAAMMDRGEACRAVVATVTAVYRRGNIHDMRKQG